jgi:hypothetical protein
VSPAERLGLAMGHVHDAIGLGEALAFFLLADPGVHVPDVVAADAGVAFHARVCDGGRRGRGRLRPRPKTAEQLLFAVELA